MLIDAAHLNIGICHHLASAAAMTTSQNQRKTSQTTWTNCERMIAASPQNAQHR